MWRVYCNPFLKIPFINVQNMKNKRNIEEVFEHFWKVSYFELQLSLFLGPRMAQKGLPERKVLEINTVFPKMYIPTKNNEIRHNFKELVQTGSQSYEIRHILDPKILNW